MESAILQSEIAKFGGMVGRGGRGGAKGRYVVKSIRLSISVVENFIISMSIVIYVLFFLLFI